ncbi:MAG: phage holin family protein [Ferruginibacter sp.]
MLQEKFGTVEEFITQLKTYVNTEIELLKLSISEKLSKAFSALITILFVAIVFLIFVLFASVSLAYFLGECLERMWAGFLIVGFLYLLSGIIAWYTREKFLRIPIMNAIIRKLFASGEEDKIKNI